MKRLSLILFAALVCYFIFLIRQDIIDNAALKRESLAAAKTIAEQKELSAKLSGRLQDLRGSRYVEELARTRLGFIRQGEVAYKVFRR